MRLVDLAVNCLKETFHNDDTNINAELLRDGTLLKNPDYANEVNNVLLSINKAISRLQTSNKIPYKQETLTPNPDSEWYDISSIKDIRKIRSVFVMKNNVPCWIGWNNISANKLYLGLSINDTIYLIYERKIKNFTESDFDSEDDLDEVYGISDEICNYINYFVKSELFEDVDPDRCKRYLNYFEQFLAEVDTRGTTPYQGNVFAKYKM